MTQNGITGILVTRQKSFTSALVGIPVYIDDKKMDKKQIAQYVHMQWLGEPAALGDDRTKPNLLHA